MILIIILMAIAFIVVGLLDWNFSYLVLSMIFVIFCWLPNADMLCDRGNEYENEHEHNQSNPLFVKGFFREKESELKLFSSFKGLYVCQIISLVLLFWTLVYLCVMNSYQRMTILEIILTIGFVVLMISWFSIKEYYKKCYKQSFRFSESTEGVWKPFSYIYQSYKLLRKYNPFSCNYYVKYEELQRKLEVAVQERNYVFSGCFEDDRVEEFRIFTRLEEEKLDVFALIHVDVLEEESWEYFNDIFETYWKQNIADKHEKKQMALTFLLCVDKYSKELRKRRNGIYTVDSKPDRYRLAAMLSYSEQSCLGIWQDYQESCGGKRGRLLRRELMEMLDLSRDYNGKQYPEDRIEDDLGEC